jgi:alkanesulfonate monooxygenase SsuD/methylene tetrahydromethanopterin reductase-like flavin-dependent oxidoreductase (luciferase family)
MREGACLAKLEGYLLAASVIDLGDEDACTLLSVGATDRGADAAAATRNERNFAIQTKSNHGLEAWYTRFSVWRLPSRPMLSTGRHVDFGYNPPAGVRGVERFPTATFVRDLQDVLDIASQSFSSLWVSDHLMTEEPFFRMDVWTELTWIAARYPGQMLGTIVLANSYRHPPLMAKMAASLQAFSRGRLILGYGAGWLEDEYRAYGYDYPPAPVRIVQMVEALKLMREMWTHSPATFHGTYYRIDNAYCEPRPDPLPIVMIGGDGEKLTLRAVAEHADWWNTVYRGTPALRHKLAVLEQHCRSVGREYGSIRKTLTRTCYLAKTRSKAEEWAGDKRNKADPPFIGEPAELVDHLQELVSLGFDLFQMVFAGFPDTTDMRLFVDRVLPAFA